MDLNLAPEDVAFAEEVRTFIDANLPDATRRAMTLTTAFLNEPELGYEWHKLLHKKGWSVPSWPDEWGGPGWTPVQKYIFDLESARAGAPVYNGQGSRMVGPVLMHFGTDEQKNKYLPSICSGEDHWCQGYSEPGSGSDLASLKTKAVADGDDYIINGQKIWTSFAHKSNCMFALVRTSTEGKRQEGITFILLDMDLPGITIRPIIGNGGDHEFNEVFFDDVRVPQSGRVGEENKGWDVAKYLLEFERGGALVAGRVRAQFAKVVRLIRDRGLIDDAHIRIRMAEIGADLDTMEMVDIRVLSDLQSGANPGAISSMLKMRWSSIRQEVSELALDAAGEDILKWEPERPLYDALQLPPDEEELLGIAPRYLNFRAYTILGGTNEIQAEILGKRVLGL
ncbi:MAG: acyl-CoA dehydrogenase [Rhodospirillaceae bacterium]|nr:acyl-CoA dehydrogenase [Rhodospirillaceae bacterium]MBT3887618.1 acyl-CoA dehydrogenase [Rhodospirillaceae bacterium]MBT4115223.1 acyl-CoA dehydrogenase [Rhodospirillaceae bacterium]MBT4671733.1 acyl-CoA dehydrogenase [Rhodospirillaceae bacterium]MBT4719019.1 acyl-CoA dehydrogenase [Rhodospirillaceae bacterium]